MKWIGLLTVVLFGFLLGCATTPERIEEGEGPRIPLEQKAPVSKPAKPPAPPAPLVPLRKPAGYANLEMLISVNVKEASLKQLLLTMAEQAGVNLVIDEDVEDKKVTVNIKKVPLWQALKAILGAHGLYYQPYPGYIRISRMLTKFFHIDYVVSVRGGESSTSVALVSGGTSDAGGATSAGVINVTSSEEIDFWKNFEERLKNLMKDPLYDILQAEYNRKKLKKDLAMLPYEEEYEKELHRHQLEIFSLQSKILAKQVEMGMPPEKVPEVKEVTPAKAEVAEVTKEEVGKAEEEELLVGSYTIDSQTGTVVVTTTPEVMERVQRFIAQVKENARRQVLIDVQILEVSLDKDKKLGIDWSSFPGTIQFFKLPDLKSAVKSAMAGAGGGGGGAGGGGIVSPLATAPFSFSPTGGLQAGILHMLSNDVAFQYTLDLLISFLKEQGEVKAISRPQLVTMNNQPAIVSVGVNDFYVTYELTTVSATAGVATTSVTSKLNPIFIGVTLHITPQISPNGDIILKIIPAINRKVDEKTVPTGIPSAPTQTIPVIETRQTSTIVRVASGQIVIISGLIQEKNGGTTKKVIGLGDVPILGYLFSHKSEEAMRSELVIIVTPRLQPPFVPNKELGHERIG